MSMPCRTACRPRAPHFAASVAAILVVLGRAETAQAQKRGEGPTTLFITYQCSPERRAAFKAHMSGPGVKEFEKWKKAGTFKEYLILFSSYSRFNGSTWDMLVRLDFDRYVDTEKWKAVDATSPGGLSAEALALCSPTGTYLTDLQWDNARSARDLAKAIYVVVGYRAHDRGQYARYFESKVKLDFDQWIEEGGLSWYGVYLSQHRAASPWDVVHLLEYTDAAALARRDVVRLKMHPEKLASWTLAEEVSSTIRTTEIPAVLADPILPR
jgi:hypothetical protein